MKPHIELLESKSHAKAIVCGAPERAQFISTFLKDAKPLAKNREYHSYLGTHEGQEILVLSHGVGASGAAICFQELINAGAKSIIRIGTAGGLYEGSRPGDIVVAVAAVRQDGVTSQMVPVEYPAIPCVDLTAAAVSALRAKSVDFKRGIVLTSDLFYPGPLGTDLQFYSDIGVVATEMECSTLFVIGALRKVRSAALLVLDGNPLKWEEGEYDPSPERLKASMEACIAAALTALTTEI